MGISKLACNSIHPVVCVAFCASSQRSTAQTVHVCLKSYKRHSCELVPCMLRGFGKIVEFDESFFAKAPKHGPGHAKGWKDEDEWVFGLVE